jgi:16S rRNA G966 N2-methylase RsmD
MPPVQKAKSSDDTDEPSALHPVTRLLPTDTLHHLTQKMQATSTTSCIQVLYIDPPLASKLLPTPTDLRESIATTTETEAELVVVQLSLTATICNLLET